MLYRFLAGMVVGALGVVAYNKKDKIVKVAKESLEEAKEMACDFKEKVFEKCEVCEDKEELVDEITKDVKQAAKSSTSKTSKSKKENNE